MERTEAVNRRAIIRCRGVSKTFSVKNAQRQVVRDLDLDVYENEFVVLFGPGQCGKSTLLNIMSGLDMPSEGSVLHNDAPVTGPDTSRGVVYQSISLFPWLTVMGNVSFGLKVQGVPKAQRQDKARELIKLVGLEGFENSYPNSLSGGMKQRVGIARAYCNDPQVLFMDEPFGALDAQTRYMMEAEISRIHTAEKRTVVFVTNNIEEALYLADRIVVLTNCPTHVKKEYKIDLPRPRNYTDSAFLALRQEITDVVDKTL